MRGRRLVVAVASLLVPLLFLAACGEDDDDGAVAPESPAEVVEPSGDSGQSGPRVLAQGFLDAGEYRTSKFIPPFSFTVGDDDWTGGDNSRSVALEQPLLLSSSLRVVRPAGIFEPGGEGEQTAVPSDLVAWLLEHPDLEITGEEETLIDGRAARQLEVVAQADAPLFAGESGVYEIKAGANGRFIILEVEGETVTILLDGPTGDWEEFITLAEPVVASIDFELRPRARIIFM